MSRPGSLRALMAMVGIFLAGGIAGGFAGAAWYKSTSATRPREVLAENFIARMTTEVQLTDEQVPEVRAVILKHKNRFDEAFGQLSRCFHDVNQALEAELSEEQIVLYRAMIERDRARHEAAKHKKTVEDAAGADATSGVELDNKDQAALPSH